MNSFSSLSLNYLLFTLVSSSILFVVFRKRMDASAIYFLIAELFMVISCALLVATNSNYIRIESIGLWLTNFTTLSSEVAILFSIRSLAKKIAQKYFLAGIFLTGLLATLLGFVRDNGHLQLAILMYATALTGLSFLIYSACKKVTTPALANNQFMRTLRLLELVLVGYGILRMLTYFSSTPIIPRDTPTDMAVLIFAIYIVISSFRYMTYVGLRITWVDPRNPSQNLLNKPLVTVLEEKDQLLRGLIASNRVIGISALASSLAHQLSQPLTAIALRAETTRRDLIPTKENTHLISSLDEISVQSGKLAELVKNLRQLFSARNYDFHPINLQNIADEILELVEPTLSAHKISLSKSYQSNPIVFGDAIQLQQVLINVFNNAIDALKKNKATSREIVIAISQNEKVAILEISDNGQGIESSALPTIFELYKTTKQSGLGVGLWLSKTILERHHGNISASNNPNGGAIFTIEIPLNKTIVGSL